MSEKRQTAPARRATMAAVIDDFERCYRFMRSRDPRYDGFFFVGVTSTGIYCRPSCPARLPQRRNVRLFATAAAAQTAGFRACKRCEPDAAPGLAGLEPARRRGRPRLPPDRRRDRRPRGRVGPGLAARVQRAPAQPHPRGRGGRRAGAAGARPARAGGAHADRVDRAALRRGGAGIRLPQRPPVQRHDPRGLRAHAQRAARPGPPPARRHDPGRGGAATAGPLTARRRCAAGLPRRARDPRGRGGRGRDLPTLAGARARRWPGRAHARRRRACAACCGSTTCAT